MTYEDYDYGTSTAPSGSFGAPPALLTFLQAVVATSPTAFWLMGEASGNLADSSGNAHTLTAGGAMTYGVAGWDDGHDAITFAADNDRFSHADHADWDFGTGDWSVMFALKHGSPWDPQTDQQVIVAHAGGGNAGQWSVRLRSANADDIELVMYSTATNFVEVLDMPTGYGTDGLWHLYIVSVDRSSDAVLYADGTSVDTLDVTAASAFDLTNADSLFVGARNTTGGDQMIGTLGLLGIWKGTALSAANATAFQAARNVT